MQAISRGLRACVGTHKHNIRLITVTAADLVKGGKNEHRGRNEKSTVDSDDSAAEAVSKMLEHNVGSIAVTRRGRVIGIVSERDYLRKVLKPGKTAASLTVKDIATFDGLIVADAGDSLAECLSSMVERNIRHLPVIDKNHGDQFLGMLSMRDIAQAFAKKLEEAEGSFADFRREQAMPVHDG